MSLLEAFILGIVQGLSEFAPVSSSAHLVLVPWLLGWDSPDLAFDTTLHLGTLLAVVVYFRADLWRLATAWLSSLARLRADDAEARLAWLLIIATIPAAVAGVVLGDWFEEMFQKPTLVGVFLLGTAAFMTTAEKWKPQAQNPGKPTLPNALAIGLAQAVAIAPGISRSGSTIATGLLTGLPRHEAARFSFLLSLPVILGAGAMQTRELIKSGDLAASAGPLIVGFVAAAVSGYLCIHFLLAFLRRHSLRAFAVYCLVIGAGAIAVALAGLRPA